MRMHNPPHPGEILKTLCLEPLKLSVTEAARSLGVSRKTLSGILNGRAGISPEMAVRLSMGWHERGKPAIGESRLMEHQFLHSKVGKLTDKECVFAAAVDGVDRPEFLEQPSGTAKFAENRSVQAHPIDLTGDIDIVPRVGIGNVEDGIGSLGDTHRLRVAKIRKRGLEDAVVVEHLDALVAAIAGIDVALRVH